MTLPMRLLIIGCLLVTVLNSLASDVKIIANPSVKATTVSITELREVFLLQRLTLRDGSLVNPVLQKNGLAHDIFLKQFLNRGSEEIRTYYQGLVFTGKGFMPEELDSDAAVVAYVARTKGAIGYISGRAEVKGVKALLVVREFGATRTLLVRIEPAYPNELQQRGIEGTVRLSLTISAKGSVESVRVVGGNPILAEAAVEAAKQWVYSPAAASNTVQVSIAFDSRR